MSGAGCAHPNFHLVKSCDSDIPSLRQVTLKTSAALRDGTERKQHDHGDGQRRKKDRAEFHWTSEEEPHMH